MLKTGCFFQLLSSFPLLILLPLSSPTSHCCFSSLRAGGSLARIYRGLLVFLCVALSALDRANTNLLIQYVVVGDSFGTFSARSQTTIDPKVTKII